MKQDTTVTVARADPCQVLEDHAHPRIEATLLPVDAALALQLPAHPPVRVRARHMAHSAALAGLFLLGHVLLLLLPHVEQAIVTAEALCSALLVIVRVEEGGRVIVAIVVVVVVVVVIAFFRCRRRCRRYWWCRASGKNVAEE